MKNYVKQNPINENVEWNVQEIFGDWNLYEFFTKQNLFYAETWIRKCGFLERDSIFLDLYVKIQNFGICGKLFAKQILLENVSYVFVMHLKNCQ